MTENKTIAALEIGTSKTLVFLGEIMSNGGIREIGMGRGSAGGVKKGEIFDAHTAAKSVFAALGEGEKLAGAATVKSVCLGISGAHLKGFRNLGSANVSGADSLVREQDVMRAREDARSKALPKGRIYIHRICCGYILDNTRFVKNPIGQKASRIDAEFWMIHGDEEKISNAMHLVESSGMSVDHMAFSGIVSGMMVTTPAQRDEGVLAIDMGCGTSDYAFFKHGKPVQACSIPVGGEHMTNDLAMGLRLSHKNAERIKTLYGSASSSEDERKIKIWTGENEKRKIGDRQIPLESINKILRARLEETFLLLREEMGVYFSNGEVKEVALTGGASKLGGICALAEGVFGVPCRPGKFSENLKEELHHPHYATILGLLNFARDEVLKEARRKKKTGLMGKFFGK